MFYIPEIPRPESGRRKGQFMGNNKDIEYQPHMPKNIRIWQNKNNGGGFGTSSSKDTRNMIEFQRKRPELAVTASHSTPSAKNLAANNITNRIGGSAAVSGRILSNYANSSIDEHGDNINNELVRDQFIEPISSRNTAPAKSTRLLSNLYGKVAAANGGTNYNIASENNGAKINSTSKFKDENSFESYASSITPSSNANKHSYAQKFKKNTKSGGRNKDYEKSQNKKSTKSRPVESDIESCEYIRSDYSGSSSNDSSSESSSEYSSDSSN
ncbi:hypothetical protein AYI70_g4987 [Smittium culicis]|uniref:Uncharacterized protein n=1 Tax=Smittium culicis TaxID=133412 RepID=A0A1R1XWU2_9FUNG|nr:hypothetical protein AYI70_g4987 [Smittium culicis]